MRSSLAGNRGVYFNGGIFFFGFLNPNLGGFLFRNRFEAYIKMLFREVNGNF